MKKNHISRSKRGINALVAKKLVEKELLASKLVGLPLRLLARRGCSLRLHFGQVNPRCPVQIGTKKEPLGEWILDAADGSAWRFTERNGILLGVEDCALSPLEDDRDPYAPGTYTRCDLFASFLTKEFLKRPPRVKSVAVDVFGGIALSFTGGRRFEVFALRKALGGLLECWQVYQRSELDMGSAKDYKLLESKSGKFRFKCWIPRSIKTCIADKPNSGSSPGGGRPFRILSLE